MSNHVAAGLALAGILLLPLTGHATEGTDVVEAAAIAAAVKGVTAADNRIQLVAAE